MNEPNLPHAKITCNPGDPLWAAQLHTAAQRLDLRRIRRDLVGSHKIATVDRLLDVNAAVARSLAWLNGKEATHEAFVGLEQLAMESAAMPEAVGVSQ
jgi:hypothetical protein